MRKKHRRNRFAPFLAGLLCGYALMLFISALSALVMWIVGAGADISWLPAVSSCAAGSFLCGRIAGRLRRRGGLKTGTLCGVLYFVPLLLLSLIFGTAGTVLMFVKAVLCVGFAAAGGVAGVNSGEVG